MQKIIKLDFRSRTKESDSDSTQKPPTPCATDSATLAYNLPDVEKT